jgi:prolyl oligopeptidase
VLLRVDVRAGHGAGKPTAKVIAVTADRLAWLTRVLDMDAAH